MARDDLAREAKELLDRIAATPRAAGSEAEARARAYCAETLRRKGFSVTEDEFTYSALPGRWAVPMVGLVSLSWFVFVGTAATQRPEQSLAAGVPFLLLPALAYLVARTIPPGRRMQRRGINLVATRGATPLIWLVAHLDSKSQPVSMLVRIAGIIAVLVAMPLSIAAGYAGSARALSGFFWILACGVGAAGSLVLLLSVVGNRSQGAVDNASGVAAAVLTASELPPATPVGVLVTSAEELGLEGTKAWVRAQSWRPTEVPTRRAINFDSIDDVGILTCMARPGNRLAASLRVVAEEGVLQMRFRRVLPGIMLDASALAADGWEAVTISKGNFSTLARIHTPRDSPDRLNGTGIAEAVEVVTDFIAKGN